MCLQEDSTDFARQLRHAASAQRTYWRNVRPEDVELLQLDELVASADAVASELEQRYKDTQSVSWEKWCQSSLSQGGRKVIQRLSQPESNPQSALQEAPATKLQRIMAEWSQIWEVDIGATIDVPSTRGVAVPPTRGSTDAPPTRGGGCCVCPSHEGPR